MATGAEFDEKRIGQIGLGAKFSPGRQPDRVVKCVQVNEMVCAAQAAGRGQLARCAGEQPSLGPNIQDPSADQRPGA
jgi:hypothetical protein